MVQPVVPDVDGFVLPRIAAVIPGAKLACKAATSTAAVSAADPNARAAGRGVAADRSLTDDPRGMTRTRKPAVASSLEDLVDDYIESFRRDRKRELRFFRVVRGDEEAVSAAALAQLPNGKRHPHQYRIPPESLAESRRRLLDNLAAIRDCGSFEELIDLVNGLIRPLDGVGELVAYDTALRIGARFGLEPQKVYVHRGTRDGARKLGLNGRRETIEMHELPAAIRKLTPREAEDFLCVYKDKLSSSTP